MPLHRRRRAMHVCGECIHQIISVTRSHVFLDEEVQAESDQDADTDKNK